MSIQCLGGAEQSAAAAGSSPGRRVSGIAAALAYAWCALAAAAPDDAAIRSQARGAAQAAGDAIPADFVGKPPVVLDSMDDLGTWVIDGTNPDVTLETDPAFVRHGVASIRLRAAAGPDNKSRITKSGLNWDLSARRGLPDGHRLGVWIYTPFVNPDVGRHAAAMYLSSDESGFDNYYSFTVTSKVQGWNRIVIDPTEFVAHGTPDWSSIRQVRFTVNSQETYEVDVTIDLMEAETATPPTVILSFDDCDDSIYTGYQEAHARGMPITVFLITQNLDMPGRLTSPQVDEIYGSGSDIGLHDLPDWDQGSEDDIYNLIDIQYQYVSSHWPRAALHLAFPHGNYGQRNDNVANVKGALDRLGIRTGRSVVTKRIQAYGGEFDERYYLGAGVLLDDTITLPEVEAFVDTLITTKTTAYIVGHKLDTIPGPNQWAIDDYRALLDFLQEKRANDGLKLSTITKWYRRTVLPMGD